MDSSLVCHVFKRGQEHVYDHLQQKFLVVKHLVEMQINSSHIHLQLLLLQESRANPKCFCKAVVVVEVAELSSQVP